MSTQTNVIYCHQCGHANDSGRSTCENCQTKLVTAAEQTRLDRPIGVSLYVGFVIAVQSIFMVAGLGTIDIVGYIIGICLIVAGVGVWRMKNWGRTGFMIFSVLDFVLGVIALSAAGSSIPGFNGGFIGGTIIRFLFIYWLATNGHRFSD